MLVRVHFNFHKVASGEQEDCLEIPTFWGPRVLELLWGSDIVAMDAS